VNEQIAKKLRKRVAQYIVDNIQTTPPLYIDPHDFTYFISYNLTTVMSFTFQFNNSMMHIHTDSRTFKYLKKKDVDLVLKNLGFKEISGIYNKLPESKYFIPTNKLLQHFTDDIDIVTELF
jgi:hypothetical protein